jgi:serine O-acetyltransferase
MTRETAGGKGAMANAEGSNVSAQTPDWSREKPRKFWNPARKLLRSIRRYQALGAQSSPLSRIKRKWWVLQHRFWSVITQADIPLNCQIEGGLMLPHPNGVVIHPEARIGPNCLIMQQVTIGTREGGGGVPSIQGHVDIGAGARILGDVCIGEHSLIGANAVVTKDVPPHSIAVGVPARVKPRRN